MGIAKLRQKLGVPRFADDKSWQQFGSCKKFLEKKLFLFYFNFILFYFILFTKCFLKFQVIKGQY